QNHVGGLLAQVLFPPLGNFGKFCLVILALSIVGNNCPNIYSLTFSLQILTHYAQYIPRFLWTFIGTIIYVAVAIPGYAHFESVLENFMLIIVRKSHAPCRGGHSDIGTGLLAGHLRKHRAPRALHLQETG